MLTLHILTEGFSIHCSELHNLSLHLGDLLWSKCLRESLAITLKTHLRDPREHPIIQDFDGGVVMVVPPAPNVNPAAAPSPTPTLPWPRRYFSLTSGCVKAVCSSCWNANPAAPSQGLIRSSHWAPRYVQLLLKALDAGNLCLCVPRFWLPMCCVVSKAD